MKTFVLNIANTTALIVGNTHIHGENKVGLAAHILAADYGITPIEAYCLIKGIKVAVVKGQTKAALEAAKVGFKKEVVHPTKLRKQAKTRKRHRRVAKVARATTTIFKATPVVAQTASRFLKARNIIDKATQKVAIKLGVSLKEVLGMTPQDILDNEGRVIPLFRNLVQAYKLAKALTA